MATRITITVTRTAKEALEAYENAREARRAMRPPQNATEEQAQDYLKATERADARVGAAADRLAALAALALRCGLESEERETMPSLRAANEVQP